MERKKIIYFLAAAAVAVFGIASRLPVAELLPAFIATYAGDTLWTLVLFLFLGIIFPRMRTSRLAVLTLAVSFGVELSQLYQAGWIDAIRGTRIGGLILGYGFKWTDLVCYVAGCLIGVGIDCLVNYGMRGTHGREWSVR